ncbi:MAG: LamG domain-containing protein, partial [Candidatus Pacebacteria bacterium]|nr:LamG domain-containing protein [Candidatus Paceibacterota bacterium]
YTYVKGSWALSAGIESAKFLADNATNDGGATTTRFEIGGGGDLVANGAWTAATVEEGPEYVTDGLVAYWDFSDGSGTTLTDVVNGHNGTINGTPAWTDGLRSSAVTFSGDDSVSSFVNGTDLNFPTSAFTYEAWVKFNDGSTSGRYFASNGWSEDCRGVRFNIIAGRAAYMLTYADGNVSYVTTSGMDTTNWHQVVAVRTADGYNHLYIDGNLDNATTGGTRPYTGTLRTDTGFNIGRSQQDYDPNAYFIGTMTAFRVYNKALSEEEIEQNYTYETYE